MGIDIEFLKFIANTSIDLLSYLLSETFVILAKFCHHKGYVLMRWQFPVGEGADGNSNVVQVNPRTLIKTPVYESRGQIRQRFPTFGAGKYENLRTNGCNGQTTDTLLAQHGTYFLIGITPTERRVLGGANLALGADGQPSFDELLLSHAHAIIAQHKQAVAAIIVDLDTIGVCVVGVLEQFTDCRRNPGNLLPPEHIQGACTCLERCHLTSAGSLLLNGE